MKGVAESTSPALMGWNEKSGSGEGHTASPPKNHIVHSLSVQYTNKFMKRILVTVDGGW